MLKTLTDLQVWIKVRCQMLYQVSTPPLRQTLATYN